MTGIGVAGWAYADWQGPVYPRSKGPDFHPLRYLSRYVDCMEINSSFYALPKVQHVHRWLEVVDETPSFRFIMKLHRSFTHEPPDAGWDAAAEDFRRTLAPIQDAKRLLAVLVQFPVHFKAGRSGRDQLHRIRDHFHDLPLSVELRHASWFEPDWLDELHRLQVGLVHIDLPSSARHPPQDHPVMGPLAYLRLHGRNARTWFDPKSDRNERYDYLYQTGELEQVARRLTRIASEAEQSVVITNNHFGGQAVANAIELKHLLSGETPLAPEPIRDAFPRLRAFTRPDGQQLLF